MARASFLYEVTGANSTTASLTLKPIAGLNSTSKSTFSAITKDYPHKEINFH